MAEIPDAIATDAITKSFGATRALDGVTISFRAGEVHSIVGENGAGKSTLMKILSGVERPTAGRLMVRGRQVVLKNVHAAQEMGIAMVHQELNLVDELSVAENIFLGREKTTLGFVNFGRCKRISRQLMNVLKCPLDVSQKVGRLSTAQKQMVEIAKALSSRASVLILDEPTAMLSRREAQALFLVIDELARTGVAVAYISHLLPEVLKISDRITVMRDGRISARISPEEIRSLTEKHLAAQMVGRPMSQHFPPRESRIGERFLEVEHFGDGDASFFVRRGEILGFAGLIGAGRSELAESLFGLRGKTDGVIRLDGRNLKIARPADAVGAGIAYLSEDRKDSGLMLDMDVTSNTTMVSLRRYTRWLIRRREEENAARHYVQLMRIRIASLRQPARALSGGNQQKVALAKWLEISPKVLIVDEPTRGVDVGAKEEIYRLLRVLVAHGMACILISSELNEVLGMSDRVAVMRNGRIASIMDKGEATEERVMQIATGALEMAHA